MNGNCKPCTERKRLLDEIGKICFTITELALYLDTHPYDQQALDLLKQYKKIEKQLKKEYAEVYGPLELDVTDDKCEWKWCLQDWPWEGGYH